MTGLTSLDFFDPRKPQKPSLESLQQLAVKWEISKPGMEVTVENSVKSAIDTVQSKYDHRGAQILVVGSVYQAGAVIILLRAGGQGDRDLREGEDIN
jgi:folylpolyglutamate synthase/dihydropteroate synthase